MKYNSEPPYELMENKDLNLATVQRLQRFARFWDLLANSGNFKSSISSIWSNGSPFHCFMACSDALHARFGRTHALPLEQLAEGLFDYLCATTRLDKSDIANQLWLDISLGGRRDMPLFLRPHLPGVPTRAQGHTKFKALARQARRL